MNQKLLNGLLAGFVNKDTEALTAFKPNILSNNYLNNKKVLNEITFNLKNCDEFWFCSAFLRMSGYAVLANTLDEISQKGTKGTMLVSSYLNFTDPNALEKILKYENISLKINTRNNLHSKFYLFKSEDIYTIIIGSSNLTSSALTHNREMNIKVVLSRKSEVLHQIKSEFSKDLKSSINVDSAFLDIYREDHKVSNQPKNNKSQLKKIQKQKIYPNNMQKDALVEIESIRKKGLDRALVVSATGTGKTHLSAFDVLNQKPKRLLYIVHRRNIAQKSLNTFRDVLNNQFSLGLFSGKYKDIDKDYIFSTVQTISKDENLNQFSSDEFDYIIIDETHRAGAKTYQKIINYFSPKFLLGMTATPERTDDYDIFSLFNHNLAYEIRLHDALAQDMLVPFHYFGITDIMINGELLDENIDFSMLVSEERVERIIDKINHYGCDSGIPKGLIFCSRTEEAKELSSLFNERNYKTIFLVGSSKEETRNEAIRKLEEGYLDYIFTVDIFNEGIDIPKLNQVIMLRPTQSAIIFVQQLGRGLRKAQNKDYLTIIDFIGNYQNNYLLPVALYGDRAYNKDKLRKLISSESSPIPGSSTINFDKISKEKIFESIDSSNLQTKKSLDSDYNLLKYKIGSIPKMMDFIKYDSRDPFQYVEYSKSYHEYLMKTEQGFESSLSKDQRDLLSFFSKEINNSKRIEESVILRELLLNKEIPEKDVRNYFLENYEFEINDKTINSVIKNLNFNFITENKNGRLLTVQEIYNYHVVENQNGMIKCGDTLKAFMQNKQFYNFLFDSTQYSIHKYNSEFQKDKFFDGLQLYRKYSRKDVFRILNWDKNPVAQNVGGYMKHPEGINCPIFVNYHKSAEISETTKYEDKFLNQSEFQWMSKSNRSLKSVDVVSIRESSKTNMRIPLFVKKSNDEGIDFYFIGDVSPIESSFEQKTIAGTSVVQLVFKIGQEVDYSLYKYLTDID